jgi:hypothetical protein
MLYPANGRAGPALPKLGRARVFEGVARHGTTQNKNGSCRASPPGLRRSSGMARSLLSGLGRPKAQIDFHIFIFYKFCVFN